MNVNFENRYTFVIEQKFQEYDTTNSMFLPGFADGGSSSSYPSSLNYFFLNQPYSLDSSSQRLQFNARPFNFLLFAGSIQLMKQEMDLSYSEGADGTTYLGRIFSYNKNGSGNFDRNINLYNLDTTLLLTHKLAIVGAFRYSTFEQTGNFLIDDTSEDAALDYKNLDFEGGLQYQFSPEFSLTAGYRNETRTLNEGIETVDFEDKTQKNSFFGNLKLDIKRKLKLTADYQRGSYEDPFTIISPSSYTRLRLTADLKVNEFSFSGVFLTRKTESDFTGTKTWESTNNQFNLNANYRADKFSLSAGYSLVDIEHKGNRVITYPPSWEGPGTFDWNILYEGTSNLLNASVAFNLTDQAKIGAYAHSYNNKGFWEVTRTTLKGYLEYTFENGLVTQLGYRYVNFEENLEGKSAGFNDYKANIVELSFGYRWQ